ncbi:MAG: hypothetical protein CMN78_03290 [Spirochaetales bacterium]|nr:hypothetical protein [Spirochaetales bacterium]
MFVLTIFWITLKRLAHNWRIAFGLLLGLILATGIMASIPIYSAGSLQKSFLQQWVDEDSFRPPLALIVSHSNQYRKKEVTYGDLLKLESYLGGELEKQFDARLISKSVFSRIGANPVLPPWYGEPALSSPKGDLAQMDNLDVLAEIILGRWYKPREDGTVELVVDEVTFERNELIIGDTFTYWYPVREGEPLGALAAENIRGGYVTFTIELVGLFRAKTGFTTEHWIYPPPFSNRVFAHPDVYGDFLLSADGLGLRAQNYDMQWVYDYSDVKVNDLPGHIAAFERIEKRATQIAPETSFWHSPLEYFEEFSDLRNQVSVFLSSLGMPMMGMVIYYIMLLAGISIDHRKKEIIVMHSRGGGRAHVAVSFLLEWLILGSVAVLVGPFLGIVVAKTMGTSAGFMSFVNRKSMPAYIGNQAIKFALAGAGVAIFGGMLPVLGTVRQSIVTFTQRRARSARRSIMHKVFLDVILTALAIYGYSRLSWETLQLEPGEQVLTEPGLFFVPVLMVVGIGLVVLRVYPLVMTIFRWVSSKIPGVIWQLTFRRLTRNAGQYVPLMLLLIVTVSLGIYSAATARTLMVNFDHQIRYAIGADIATEEEWQDPEVSAQPVGQVVSEPPFYMRQDLPGVRAAARVLNRRVEVRRAERWSGTTRATMLAIEPHEFARTAWFRNDFGDAAFLEYLALLSRHREGVLIQSSVFENAELALGDTLTIQYRGQEVPAYVAGSIDYWPTLNPYQRPFIIMNLEHFQDYTALEQYEVWYRMEKDGKAEDLVSSLRSMGIYVTRLRNTRTELVEMRREPYRMGFFGLLSMGFLVSAIITALGFFIYNYFSIRGRLVQLGALRAMGLTSSQIIGLVGLEQLFTIGSGLAIGAGMGGFISKLFLPLFRFRARELNPVPPFIIVLEQADVSLIMVVTAALFLLVIAGLSVALSRLRVNQAIKLGEEA